MTKMMSIGKPYWLHMVAPLYCVCVCFSSAVSQKALAWVFILTHVSPLRFSLRFKVPGDDYIYIYIYGLSMFIVFF